MGHTSKMDAIRIVAVLGLVVTNIYAGCPDNFLTYKESCYLFGTVPEEFVVAEQYCLQHDAHLVHVNDAVENNFLKHWLRRFHVGNWWMDLNDELVEGNWEWQDTHNLATFTDWGPGQPNNYASEDCAGFFLTFDYQWDDIVCTDKRYPVCEKSRTATEIVG